VNNYQCRKCGKVLQSERSPNFGTCQDGSSHRWDDLGKVGNTNYQCRKCGKVLQSERSPSFGTCQDGSSHRWDDLGKVGNTNYQCRKCGKVLQSEKLPSFGTCQDGSSHRWDDLGKVGNTNYQSRDSEKPIQNNYESVPDYESARNTKGKTKPSIGGIIVPIVAFLFIVFELIGDFFKSVGNAGYIILPIVIGFTIFRIWREFKFIFHIFNCVWILFIISLWFSEMKKDMSDTKLVIFSIIFFLLLILLPTFIRFIFNKIRKKIMGK
jgi:phage FluMu protein Com